jgi:hypothetical protein
MHLFRHLPQGRLAAGALALVLTACAMPQPLPIGQVIDRGRQGQSADQIIGAVHYAKTTYALRGSDFGKLHDAGVPDPVLDYLQQSFFNDVDYLTRYWVLGESVGGCVQCVPQQVDLSNPQQPRQFAGPTAYYGSRPQGMPEWYRPYSARSKPISLDQIRTSALQNAPVAELVQTIRTSRLEPVTGREHLSSISTHATIAITGSQLARMHAEGVPDPVLDAVQESLLGQFVELQRLRYQNLGKGPGSFQ